MLATPAAPKKQDSGQELSDDLLASALENTDQLVNAAQALSDHDWATAALALTDVIGTLVEKQASEAEATKLGKSLEALRKYLPLFIEIANADSSADVNAALQAAFPAGGYKLKYRQRTVSLNAFLGGYGGGVYQLSTKQLGPEFGMFAPIGVQYTGPLRRKREDRKPWHMGLFVAVIDLGAITTSKWLEANVPDAPTDGTITVVDEPSKFNIAGLVSPGAYWTIGVASSPFTFGLGASVNPFSQLQSDEVYAAGELVDSTQRYLSTLRFWCVLGRGHHHGRVWARRSAVREPAVTFAREFYAKALMFQSDHERALERAALRPSDLVDEADSMLRGWPAD